MAVSIYSSDGTLVVGSKVFLDKYLSKPAFDGIYSDGYKYCTVVDGTVVATAPCEVPTTTTTTIAPTTTSTTTQSPLPTTTSTTTVVASYGFTLSYSVNSCTEACGTTPTTTVAPETTTTTTTVAQTTSTTTIAIPSNPVGCPNSTVFSIHNINLPASVEITDVKSDIGQPLQPCSQSSSISTGESAGYQGAFLTGYEITLSYGVTPTFVIKVYVDDVYKDTISWNNSPQTIVGQSNWGVQANSNVKFLLYTS